MVVKKELVLVSCYMSTINWHQEGKVILDFKEARDDEASDW